jgi:hypothetical protein
MFASQAFAAACDKPVGPEDFCGTYRAGPKTSFYKIHGQVVEFEPYDTVKELVQSLPNDQSMRDRYRWSLKAAPTARVAEERHNVEITNGYIVAVKPGEDDRDFHVIVSSSPNRKGAIFVNVEVSGLPLNGVDKAQFEEARSQILALLPEGSDQGTKYILLKTAIKVTIRGSVYFDGDHRAGCQQGCPGPTSAKPQTVWEIHPVYSITTPEVSVR